MRSWAHLVGVLASRLVSGLKVSLWPLVLSQAASSQSGLITPFLGHYTPMVLLEGPYNGCSSMCTPSGLASQERGTACWGAPSRVLPGGYYRGVHYPGITDPSINRIL